MTEWDITFKESISSRKFYNSLFIINSITRNIRIITSVITHFKNLSIH